MLPVDAEPPEGSNLNRAHQNAEDAWARYAQTAQQLREAWPAGRATEILLDEVRC